MPEFAQELFCDVKKARRVYSTATHQEDPGPVEAITQVN